MARTGLVLDSAGLIVLGRLRLLSEVAEVFGPLAVPTAVLTETAVGDRAGALEIRQAVDGGLLTEMAGNPDPATGLGSGESAAIALARQIDAPAMLDDRQARTMATIGGVQVIGTLAVLVGLKKAGRIARVAPILAQLRALGFRMSDELGATVLRAAGEAPES
jgi:predicted nucleic acid-binding protein